MEEKKVVPLSPVLGGAAFSLNVIFYLLLTPVAAGIIALFSLSGDGSAYVQLLVSPIAITVTSLMYFFYTRQPVGQILPVKTKPRYYAIGLLLIFGLLFSLSSLNDLLVKLFELMGYTRKQSVLPDMSGVNVIPAIIVIAVIPAVAEEVLFRGIILGNAHDGAGSALAIVFSGLCFSLYHGSVEQTLYQFICGCLFAFLAVRSRSIAPTVFIHFLNNALIIILCACGCTDVTTGELIMPPAAEITLTVLSALSLIGAVVWLILDKTELKKRSRGGAAKFLISAGIGLLAMLIIWVVNLFV